jgi:hypothetical protein
VVTSLLDLCHAGIYFNELSLAKWAPVRRAIEEKDQAVLSHEVGQFMWFAGLIKPGADVWRFGSDGRAEVFGETRGSTEKCDRRNDCRQAQNF